MPVVVGAAGVPAPSVQESFCIQEMPNWPAALELKMALFGAVAVSERVMDWMDHWPAPNWLLKEARAPERSNRRTLWNSPLARPGAATERAPAPP